MGKPVPQFHQTTLFPVGLVGNVTGIFNTAGDGDIPFPVGLTMNSTAFKQVLDSIKVISNVLVLWTTSVDLQAAHQVLLKVCANLSALDKEHTGHGQLHQHQDEQQNVKSNQHAAILLHASQHSQITHTGDDGTGGDQGIGGVDGPEAGDERRKPGVHHLELPQCHHEGTTQLQHRQERQRRLPFWICELRFL